MLDARSRPLHVGSWCGNWLNIMTFFFFLKNPPPPKISPLPHPTPFRTHWLPPTTTRARFPGNSAMQALPDSGTTFTSVSSSPFLTYSIQLTNSGSFNLWIRGWAANGLGDSVYLGLDGGQAQALTYGVIGTWIWKSVPLTIPNAGTH